MFLGLDIGTSAVKAVLVDGNQRVIGQASASLTVSRLRPLWSEQWPDDWWTATGQAVGALGREHRLDGVLAVGLSGQMHGAVLLDRAQKVLRPAILWNDGRSFAQCAELERRCPALRRITGNPAMPGFTAPKLLWVAQHEPELFAATSTVLLPKDHVRLRLTGECLSDLSDSAGTLWLDVGARRWSAEALAATGLSEAHMPGLVEGNAVAGRLTAEAASALGLPVGCPVAGGGGDNAAGAIGVGAIRDGEAFLSLGTSGVLFTADDRFRPDPDRAVHAFCHALPGTWHRMAVILSAASALDWAVRATGSPDVATLLSSVEADMAHGTARLDRTLFLPYLSGERTPHNDPAAAGVLFGLTHDTGPAAIGRAVLEGVAFAIKDGFDVLADAGAAPSDITVIGGGARSPLWGRLIAAALDRPLTYRRGAETGPAFGAARLARLALTGEDPVSVCTAPHVERVVAPEPDLVADLAHRLPRWRRLYSDLNALFQASLAPEGPT